MVVSSNLVTTTKVSNTSAGTTPNGGSTVTTHDKIWILSFTEYVKSIAGSEIASKYWDDNTHDGSVYGFWEFKNFPPSTPPKAGSEHALTVGALAANRSGYRRADSYAWERSVSPSKSDGVNLIFETGNISAGMSNVPLSLNYIAPSFAM